MTDGPGNPITISYADLLAEDTSHLHEPILKAFGSGPDCLGLIVVRDLPSEFAKLRENALRASARFAQDTPKEARERYTDPESSYSFGWSHGKEIMNGRPDTLKGSYYANPTVDDPDVSEAERKQNPSYLRRNIYPSEEDCPGFQQSFKELASFMTETGKRLAKACDHLVASHSTASSIESMIADSRCSKARLLHYYPPAGQTIRLTADDGAQRASTLDQPDSWCGTHNDHSLLTALCPAMYLFHPSSMTDAIPLAVPAPTASAGLFIHTRAGKTVKATFPADCLAFQTGEALQLLTGGRLQATPHFVAAGSEGSILSPVRQVILDKIAADEKWKDVAEGNISRETMAVFLQPDVQAKLSDSETFGQFTKRVLEEHYAVNM